jgi:hypothetical protein
MSLVLHLSFLEFLPRSVFRNMYPSPFPAWNLPHPPVFVISLPPQLEALAIDDIERNPMDPATEVHIVREQHNISTLRTTLPSVISFPKQDRLAFFAFRRVLYQIHGVERVLRSQRGVRKGMDRLVELRSGGGYISGWNIVIIRHLRVAPTVSRSMNELTASARIDRTPLSFRIVLTLRFGSNSIDPILMYRVRRAMGGVSGAEGGTDYNQSSRRGTYLR